MPNKTYLSHEDVRLEAHMDLMVRQYLAYLPLFKARLDTRVSSVSVRLDIGDHLNSERYVDIKIEPVTGGHRISVRGIRKGTADHYTYDWTFQGDTYGQMQVFNPPSNEQCGVLTHFELRHLFDGLAYDFSQENVLVLDATRNWNA